MNTAAYSPSVAARVTAALALALLIVALLVAVLLRPATRAPIAPVWEPRPAILDQIPGSPGPPAR